MNQHDKIVNQNADLYFLPGWLEMVKSNDWKYYSYRRDVKCDVTSLFGDVKCSDADSLLDYLFQVKYATKNVPDALMNDFMGFVEKYMYASLGYKYFPYKFGAIMIMKE